MTLATCLHARERERQIHVNDRTQDKTIDLSKIIDTLISK